MPKSKNYDNWVKQNYPRKCEHCDYVSNNPSMYSYHKKTHEPIPAGQLCNHGCGQPALFRGTGGKYTCVAVAHHCTEYLRKHSERVKKQWEDAEQRKEKTKQIFLKHCCGVPEVIQKMANTKREKFGILTPEQAKDYRHYARAIRQRAQQWARAQGYEIGQQTYHVDHKLSILDAWHAGLSADIVNHPANLQILEAKKNSAKGAKSGITVEELLNRVRA